jgi:hypothetical protein
MEIKQYITINDLLDLGFAGDSESLQRLLATVNRKVAERINTEIPIEIKHNYDENLLKDYLKLVSQHGFSSDTTQRWLKKHIANFSEITTDHINIMLADLRQTRDSKLPPHINQPAEKPRPQQ